MRRFIWSTLVHRPGRTATLGVGILVAAVSFTLLTAAVRTTQLQVRGTVSQNFRPAYDILVRPPGTFTSLERRQDLVQQNYLSGIFGGITFRQYHQIRRIPGVEVAAPIANVGYVLPFQFVPMNIDRFLSQDPVQMYRLRLSWVADGGLSTYPDSDQYVYLTRDDPFRNAPQLPGGIEEVVPGEGPVNVCSSFIPSKPIGSGSPFALGPGTGLACFSEKTPDLQGGTTDFGALPSGQVGAVTTASFPLFIAAIDPVQEQRLVDFDRALVSGRLLRPDEGSTVQHKGAQANYRVVPVLASTRTYVDETLRVAVERLSLPTRTVLNRNLTSDENAFRFVKHLLGTEVGSLTVPIADVYERLVRTLSEPMPKLEITYDGYWSASPVDYTILGSDRLAAVPAKNPVDVFQSGYYGAGWAPQENRDVQFRRLRFHQGGTTFLAHNVLATPALQVVGRFDPTRLPGFSPLSRVPLETYYPPQVEPADPASREVLHGQPLLPTQNLGGYIAQPPLLLTTLRGLKAFTNPQFFEGASPDAPISVIRVRVAGVTGPDPLSRERIRRVAQAIHDRTGLTVDVTAGSSPQPLLVQLPAGNFGAPPLLVREGWVKKGVAVVYLKAVDRKSLALFVLVLVVCGAFLANGTLAAVRARRREIGTLLALGWTRAQVFRAVLGEVCFLGVVAGCAGAVLAVALAAILSLDLPLVRAAVVIPVGAALALAAGFVPAWRASRVAPLDAVRPVVFQRGPGRKVRRLAGMALVELRRIPGRTLLAAAALFLGVGALALLLAIDLAFRGAVAGTLLGAFISVQVRGVDYVGVALAVALAGLSVADVLYLNLRERAPELVTLRASGWTGAHLGRVVAYEGLGIGLLGSTSGAVIGVALAAAVGGAPVGATVAAAGLAAACGTAVAVAASAIPAALVSRAAPPAVLAEE